MKTDNKQLILLAFQKVIETADADEQAISHFFHKDYKQYVDGVQIDFNGFVQHMKSQKKVIESISVSFRNIIAEEDTVFTNHDVAIQKNSGGVIRVHVLAEFTISEGKIIRCDELTRMEEGNTEDHDIGSRTH